LPNFGKIFGWSLLHIVVIALLITTPNSTTADTDIQLKSGYTLDQPVVVQLKNGVGTSGSEWMGIFDSDTNSLKHWRNTNGLKNAEFNLTNSITIGAGINKPGNYEIRYFANDTYEPTVTKSLVISKGTEFKIIPIKRYISIYDPLIVSLYNTPTGHKNWIGLYKKGDTNDRKHIWWRYLPDAVEGDFELPSIDDPGSYEIRAFLNNGYAEKMEVETVIATSQIKYPLRIINNPVAKDEPITVLLPQGLNPDLNDWVGIYTVDEANPRNYISWRYTKHANASNILQIPEANLAPGQYEARLFKNNRYEETGRTTFDIHQPNITEATIALIGNLDWIVPQIFEKTEGQGWPVDFTKDIIVHSRHRVESAQDVETGEFLPIQPGVDGDSVVIPPYRFSKVIKLKYQTECIDCETEIKLPVWVDNELINGYTALASGYFYSRKKHGDSFDNANARLRDLGFTKITRMAKGHTSRFSTLWPSYAITSANGNKPLASFDDAVASFSEDAQIHGLDLIAYYKNMGDKEALVGHEEWECKTPDGKITDDRFVMMDFSSPWRDVVSRQILELAERGVKGIYFDFVHMPPWGCFGTLLQTLFEQQTGLEAPERSSAGHHWSNHENWAAYMEFQSETIAAAFRYWKLAVQAQYPDFIFIISTTYLSGLTSPMHGNIIALDADLVKVEFDHGQKKGLRHSVFEKDQADDQNLAKPSDDVLTILAHTVPRDFTKSMRFHTWAYGFSNSDQLKGFITSALSFGGIPDVFIPEQYLRSDFNSDNYIPAFSAQTPFEGLNSAIEYGLKMSRGFTEKHPLHFAGVYFEEKTRNSLATDYESAWREYIWPSVGAYTTFMQSGIPVIAVNKHTILEKLKKLELLYIPFERKDADSNLAAALLEFEEKGGIILERDRALEWDTPSGTANAHRLFKQRVAAYKSLSPFSVTVPDTGPEVYPFFYTH